MKKEHHFVALAISIHQPWHPPEKLLQVIESTRSGFLYDTLFGGALAIFDEYRESPHRQHFQGILHHAKANVSQTASRITMVSYMFRQTSLEGDTIHGGDTDMWMLW